MARQSGIIKLKGSIGDISFYKSADGHMARFKGGVDGKRIATDPAFKRTRENGMEFGRAGKGGKLVRNSLQLLLQQAKDKRVVSRLTKALLAIIKTDSVNERGNRTLAAGTFELLTWFDFNIRGILKTSLFAPYETLFNRVTGICGVHLPPFNPQLQMIAPAGTSHYKLRVGVSELDFEEERYVFTTEDSGILPYSNAVTAALDLDVSLGANSSFTVLQVLCLEFYQEVNGTMYPLNNGAFNAMSVVLIDQVV